MNLIQSIQPINKYIITTEAIDYTASGGWNRLIIKIFTKNGDSYEQLGEYGRNYDDLFKTFYPFHLDGQDYALYSSNYSWTSVMTLPDCTMIAEEPTVVDGFCPQEYYIPRYVNGRAQLYMNDEKLPITDFRINENLASGKTLEEEMKWEHDETGCEFDPIQYYPFGFVAGCKWGDDLTRKIQFFDLSQLKDGIIKREERFGYIHLPKGMSLGHAIRMGDYEMTDDTKISTISIATERFFNFETGKAYKD